MSVLDFGNRDAQRDLAYLRQKFGIYAALQVLWLCKYGGIKPDAIEAEFAYRMDPAGAERLAVGWADLASLLPR